MSDKLPDKILHIDALRIFRGAEKRCKCKDRSFVVDTQNHTVNCGSCGAIVDPFEAMKELSEHYERLEYEVEALLQQRREIAAYQPHRIVIRDLERHWQGGKMLPTCPNCSQPIHLEKLSFWVNAEIYGPKRQK